MSNTRTAPVPGLPGPQKPVLQGTSSRKTLFTFGLWGASPISEYQVRIGSSTSDDDTGNDQRYLFYPHMYTNPEAGAGLSLGTNNISVYVHSGGYMSALAVYNPNTKNPVEPQLGTGWNHIVVSYTNRVPKIYLNGVLVHNGVTGNKSKIYPPDNVGGQYWGHFPGIVDEVVIYGASLNDAEVLARCQAVGQCP